MTFRSSRRAAQAVLLATLLLPHPAPAATPASAPVGNAADFVTRVKAVEKAARPASEIETWTFTAGGLSGTDRIVRRGDDESETIVEGPFTTRRGSLAGTTWHQNENGYTIVDTPEPSQAVRMVRETLVREATPPRLVLSQNSSGGVTQRTFYDPADLVVVRREAERDGHVYHLDYSDFRRTANGRRKAWRMHGADDHGDTYDAALASDDLTTAVGDADFAIPGNSRTLVEFPDGVDEVHLPASVDFGRIHVTVNVNGYPLTFLLDSGASGIFINPEAAKEVGLHAYGAQAMTVAGTFTFSRVIAPTVSVGPLVMHDVVMGTVPLDTWEGSSARVVGLLGYDFIAGTALRVTYGDEWSSGAVDAIRPSAFTPPPLASANLAIRLNQQVPVARVQVGDAMADDMIVDTGAEAPIILFDRFVQAHPRAVTDEGINTGFDPDQSVVFGVGGRVRIIPLRLSSFKLADLQFKNFIVLRAADRGAFGNYNNDGLLGALFLRYFTLYLDYPHEKLYFEANDNHRQAVGHSL